MDGKYCHRHTVHGVKAWQHARRRRVGRRVCARVHGARQRTAAAILRRLCRVPALPSPLAALPPPFARLVAFQPFPRPSTPFARLPGELDVLLGGGKHGTFGLAERSVVRTRTLDFEVQLAEIFGLEVGDELGARGDVSYRSKLGRGGPRTLRAGAGLPVDVDLQGDTV